MHTRLAPFFDAVSLRTALYPLGESSHDGPPPVETDDTRAIADQLNVLLANPQDGPALPATARGQPRQFAPPPPAQPVPANQPNAW